MIAIHIHKFIKFNNFIAKLISPRILICHRYSNMSTSTSVLNNNSNSKSQVEFVDEYILDRNKLFEKYQSSYMSSLLEKPHCKITVTLPDNSTRSAISYETSPYDIALNISKSLADKVVVAQVDGQLWDLMRPLESSCSLKLLTFDDDEGKKVFWHSSAHIMGEACELYYKDCKLCVGPPIEEGFYYEMYIGKTEQLNNLTNTSNKNNKEKENDAKVITQDDYIKIQDKIKNIVKENQKFERLELTKSQLLEMFKYNPFKTHLINSKIKEDEISTVYRCGKLIDLCKGPHVISTGKVKALSILKNSASYFLADANNKQLQRLYGISYPDNKKLKEYLKFIEEAKSRDHRKIGKEQYRHRRFMEVITPNIYDIKLWKTSGHWENYQENMFSFEVEKTKFALKPMNCPGHCIMFKQLSRSYKELPLRYADFGVLHRNEYSGALSGLTRVRRFQQDDAHIFCTQDQIEQEIIQCFDFIDKVYYKTFGFSLELKLSTRPSNYIGEIEVWNNAEKQLENALNKTGYEWKLNPGDGAFYGPKIDISISDALKRKHQCATIQLDFQLPKRFELQYRTEEKASDKEIDKAKEAYKTPVLIHRAIYGSLERIIAILTENFAGKWPLWISPNAVVVIPVAHAFDNYAIEVNTKLREKGIESEVDLTDITLNKKIRNVVGQEELDTNSVNVRDRDDQNTKKKGEKIDLDQFTNKCLELIKTRKTKHTNL